MTKSGEPRLEICWFKPRACMSNHCATRQERKEQDLGCSSTGRVPACPEFKYQYRERKRETDGERELATEANCLA